MFDSLSTKGLEVVRRKPGMYIGGTDRRALHQCVMEVVANALDEYVQGRGSVITVSLHADGSISIQDEGGGISTDIPEGWPLSFVELILSQLEYPEGYHRELRSVLGVYGVGTKCVNAVSEWMQVDTVWKGNTYRVLFKRGHIDKPLAQLEKSDLNVGTRVRFKPDAQIFKETKFERELLSERLRHLAVLFPTLQFWLIDERVSRNGCPLVERHYYPNGILDYLQTRRIEFYWMISEPFVFRGEISGIKIEAGFQFNETGNTSILSYVNCHFSMSGGTHVQGMLQGMVEVFNSFLVEAKPLKPKHLRFGLDLFIGVWLKEPRYAGSVKARLINPEVEFLVREFVRDSLSQQLSKADENVKHFVERISERRHGKSYLGEEL